MFKHALCLFVVMLSVAADARTFVHPGIDCSRADIERARAMVAGGREPWASAFAALRELALRRSPPFWDGAA